MSDIPTIDLTGKAVDQAGLSKLIAANAPRRLVGADFSGLSFGEADLNGWQFEACTFGHAKLIRTRLAETRWSNCKGAFADFGRADLIDAEIVASDFNNAIFRQTILTSVAFRRSKLTGADFTDARTVDLKLEEVLAVDARLPKVSFRDQTLTQVDLSGALLEGADFRDVVFENCSLRDAQLIRARFEGADLRGADLGGIRLDDAAHFRGAIISRAQATSLLKELGLRVL
ncbi:pentapeptide repeat-containing protein [Pleomorphomonas oryzae]|uniref:pentapeptide repeat-containing protein n=1 Tax=Pleomorphomonas oryzae TaxID=261934 RepID=UPI000402E55C|nr:pentapeptide repeat-containing protein [Pleomorphomonas oryzae]